VVVPSSDGLWVGGGFPVLGWSLGGALVLSVRGGCSGLWSRAVLL
jgi:hypothetical protein